MEPGCSSEMNTAREVRVIRQGLRYACYRLNSFVCLRTACLWIRQDSRLLARAGHVGSVFGHRRRSGDLLSEGEAGGLEASRSEVRHPSSGRKTRALMHCLQVHFIQDVLIGSSNELERRETIKRGGGGGTYYCTSRYACDRRTHAFAREQVRCGSRRLKSQRGASSCILVQASSRSWRRVVHHQHLCQTECAGRRGRRCRRRVHGIWPILKSSDPARVADSLSPHVDPFV